MRIGEAKDAYRAAGPTRAAPEPVGAATAARCGAAEAEVTPATVSQVDTLAQKVQQLASKVGLMGRRPRAEALDSWRVDVELRGGHRPSETIGFVAALMDLDDQQSRALPPGVILASDFEPWWLTAARPVRQVDGVRRQALADLGLPRGLALGTRSCCS